MYYGFYTGFKLKVCYITAVNLLQAGDTESVSVKESRTFCIVGVATKFPSDGL